MIIVMYGVFQKGLIILSGKGKYNSCAMTSGVYTVKITYNVPIK